jgi:hypothetical protein
MEDGNFMSFEDFQVKFKIKIPILSYYGCVSAVCSYLHKIGITLTKNRSDGVNNSKAYTTLINSQKGTTIFYKVCIGEPPIPNSCKSWEKIIENDVDWNKSFVTTKKNPLIK